MNYAWIVFHERPEDEDNHGGFKIIGIYDSQEGARAAIERTKNIVGFSDFKDIFSSDRYEVNHDYWQDGFLSAR